MTPVRLLLIEDSDEDALLLQRELARAGYRLTVTRVWTPEDLRSALETATFDLAISDWSMPRLDALAASKQIRALDRDLPILIVSGTIDEEAAVGALRAGADDFMSKNRLARLPTAIDRALRERAMRQKDRETERQLEAQRQRTARSERLLRMVLDAVPDGVLVASRDRRILDCNPAARRMLGIAADETELDAVYRRWTFTLVDKKSPIDPKTSPLARAIAGESIDDYELIGRTLEGGVRHFVTSARPFVDEAAGYVGAVAMFRDVTHERATQEQLMLSDRLASVGMLAAGVAHEINNPLAASLANLELVRSVLGEGEAVPAAGELGEVREMIGDAFQAAQRVREIVRDLKIFARHEDIADHAVELQPMLESTARMAWNEIRHRATLVKEYGATPPVRGSESRLGQVFLNLLVNAAQAIPEGNARDNHIRIRTGMTPTGMAFVEISDTGTGMSADTKRQLFTPFFTTKPKGEGTGIGLSIVYRIIKGLGGDVEVESELGAGTTFRVSLPKARRTSSEIQKLVLPPETRQRLRILAIDDEPMILQALQRRLGRQHEVRVTPRAAEALAWMQAGERFDAILCDLMMPQMTGMDLYHALDGPQRDRIIFVTGGAFTQAAREFLDEVPNRRIEKPFNADELDAILATIQPA